METPGKEHLLFIREYQRVKDLYRSSPMFIEEIILRGTVTLTRLNIQNLKFVCPYVRPRAPLTSFLKIRSELAEQEAESDSKSMNTNSYGLHTVQPKDA